MYYSHKSRGEQWRGEVRGLGPASPTTEARGFAHGDVWHSVWKRIEAETPTSGNFRSRAERPVQAPRDYVVET